MFRNPAIKCQSPTNTKRVKLVFKNCPPAKKYPFFPTIETHDCENHDIDMTHYVCVRLSQIQVFLVYFMEKIYMDV